MLGILLAVSVAFLKSFGELTGKILTKENSKKTHIDEFSLALGSRYFAVIILIPTIFLLELPSLSFPMLGILLISSILNCIGSITTLKAVKYGDLSLVGPLSSLTIPFLVVSGFIIAGELPNLYGFLGVILIFFGTYFLQIAKSENGLLGPIKALFNDIGAKYMIITSILWSLTTPLDKIGVVEYGVFQWMLYTNIVMSVFLSIYIFKYKRGSFKEITNINSIKKVGFFTLLTGGALVIQMFALKLTLAVYVIAIKRASGIFSVLFGALFFKEKDIFWKLIAASIMLVGVGIITIFGNI